VHVDERLDVRLEPVYLRVHVQLKREAWLELMVQVELKHVRRAAPVLAGAGAGTDQVGSWIVGEHADVPEHADELVRGEDPRRGGQLAALRCVVVGHGGQISFPQ
jgi:hypothetical protein